jgi:hypothetical protein
MAFTHLGDRQIRQLVPVHSEPIIGEDDVVLRNMQQFTLGNIIPWDGTLVEEIIVLMMSYFLSGRIVHLVGLGELKYY